jgi:nicotinamide-nucleotide adenylyltransferase
MGAAFYITIYDNWGRRKHELLKGAGLRTAILWDRPPEQKGLSGAYVRDLMARGGGWESLVPECVARLLKEWGVPDRLGKIRQNQKTD